MLTPEERSEIRQFADYRTLAYRQLGDIEDMLRGYPEMTERACAGILDALRSIKEAKDALNRVAGELARM